MVKTDFSMADVNGFTISKEELDRAFDERFPVWIKEKLQNASVAIAGLGGLGSNIAVSLARSGVGHLFLVDFDVVDVTNLNRQMYLIPHLGMPKTLALGEILSQINPRDVGERELCQLLCAYRSEQHGRLDLLRPVLVAFGKELRVQTEFTASRSVRFDSRPDQCYYIYTPLGV